METYRLFIAAELPIELKAELVAAQERLRRGNWPVKWVAPEALHLTLRFLGDTNVELIPDLGAALGTALRRHAAMHLRLSGVGAFPNEHRPSVVWAGIGGAVAALGLAQADIEAAIIALGIAPETKPFRAHLTLGRVRREASLEQRQRLGAAIRALPPPKPIPWALDRVVLFRSELGSDGPTYTEVLDSRLQIAS
jgi:RNA 2',3'-cyclic 3'-phosphodiesterase